MATSIFTKLISGLLLFFILARFLGPFEYGVLMYHYSLAVMTTLVIEYGYTTYLVKCGGESPENISVLMQEAFATKLYLLLIYLIICLSYFIISLVQYENVLIFIVMMVTAIVMSYADFVNIAFRGVQQFKLESKTVVVSSIIHFFIIGGAVFFYRTGLAISCAFLVSRVVYLILSYNTYYRYFSTGLINVSIIFNKSIILDNLKSSFSYASDNALVNIRSYMDVIIVNFILGHSAVGLYQAGMNIVKSIENLMPIFANVYLPKLAALHCNLAECNRYYIQLVSLMFFIGIFILAIFLFVDESIINLVFGSKYTATVELYPLFGVFLLCRFITISQGVVVTAFGLQRYRMYAGILSLFIMIISLYVLVQQYGVPGAVVSNIIVCIFLLLYFSGLLAIKKIKLSFNVKQVFIFVIITISLAAYFLGVRV